MGKALKVFIILNLLLSAGVIAMGVKNFSERKLLKAETLELEKTMQALSSDLKWGETVAWEKEGEAKAIGFSFSQPTTAEELSDLKTQLDPITRFASLRQSQLEQRNQQLLDTKSELADTKDTLTARERDLTLASNQESDLNTELNKTNTELANAKTQEATLRTAKASKEGDISTKRDKITEMNNTVADLEISLETRNDEIKKLQSEYDRCRFGAAGEEKSTGKEVRGKTGLVLAVNQEWEFVVIDKGNIPVDTEFEALVHRGKEYVGKLTIIQVEDQLAVAEIVPGSIVKGESIQPGDRLFF